MASRTYLWRRTASAFLHRPLEQQLAPASLLQVKRGFGQPRPEDSSTSNWGAGEPPIDEKATKRGAKAGGQEKGKSDLDSGEVPTPNLSRQKSTRDFINTKREERMRAAQGSTQEVQDAQKMQKEVTETGAAHPGNVAG